MAEEKEKLQVNVDFTNFPELYKQLMQMIENDGDTDRSKFMRKLVREEHARRAQLPLPLPESNQKKSEKRAVDTVAA